MDGRTDGWQDGRLQINAPLPALVGEGERLLKVERLKESGTERERE